MKGTKRFGLLRLPMVLLLVLVLRLTMEHFVLQGVARHLVPMSSGVVGSNLGIQDRKSGSSKLCILKG